MADEAGPAPAVGSADDASAAPSGDDAARPADPPPLAAKANDLEALRKAVEDAATASGNLWLSYLFTLFYLLIAAGAVTHQDLFFEKPVKLPFLSVDLPLSAFFALGPLIFLVLHAYVLLHFVVLAGKIGAFDDALRDQVPDEDTRRRLRRQLPSSIFVQFLAGPREVRRGVIGFLLGLVAWISLVIGPLVLFLFFELQFLPYHDETITWSQRIFVLLDLFLLWLLWPKVLQARADEAAWPRIAAIAGYLVCGALSLVVLTFPFGIATFSGEWLYDKVPPALVLQRKVLFEGRVDETLRRPTSFFSNVLVLPGLDVIDHAKFDNDDKIAALKETVSLRGRHLEGAVLRSADLRKADFTGAALQGASLVGAYLDGASLDRAQLQGASLDDAWLQGALLDFAQLQGASLTFAHLPGAYLNQAHLQGAHLDSAQLQGASLDDAWLQGASLNFAHLQGARLDGAQLQGAWLNAAQLQGAWLISARLQGASLGAAQLQGALLDNAQLQGASLEIARLQGASLEHVFVWRADGQIKDEADGIKTVTLQAIVTDPRRPCKPDEKPGADKLCEWSKANFVELKQEILSAVPAGPMRDAALKRIDPMLNPDLARDSDQTIADAWHSRQDRNPPPALFEETRAEIWKNTGCAADGAPFVVAALVGRLSIHIGFGPSP